MSEVDRRLLLAIVKGHRRLEAVLEGFLELDLPGATVVDARDMGQIVATEIPVFSGLRSLFHSGTEESYAILSVLTDRQAREAFALMQDACGDPGRGGGLAITLPVIDALLPPPRNG